MLVQIGRLMACAVNCMGVYIPVSPTIIFPVAIAPENVEFTGIKVELESPCIAVVDSDISTYTAVKSCFPVFL